MAKKLCLTAILIAIMCQLSQQKPLDQFQDAYKECKKSKCFGMPEGCLDKQSCDVLLIDRPTDTGADFVMFWNRGNDTKNEWVGAALSTDEKMGDDSVTECLISSNNMVIVRQGLTHCSKEGCGVDTVEPVKGITNENGSYTNNIVTCSWSRTDDTMVKTFDFNIVTTKYYVFLAYGPTVNDTLKHHSDIYISKDAEILGLPAAGNTTTQGTTPSASTPASSATAGSTARGSTSSAGTSPPPTASQTAGNSTATTSSSNSTTPSGNSSTSTEGNSTSRPGTTAAPGGSTTITFSLSLAIFMIIIFSLNL